MGKYRHLTPEDREQIGVLRAAGFTMCAIASLIGKSPSTISRELRRNTLDSGRYSANVADGAYMERRQRSAILEQDEKLAAFVRQRLSEAPLSTNASNRLPGSGISPADIRMAAIRCRAKPVRRSDGDDLCLHLPSRPEE
jgi:IS30 family transposase